MGKPDHEPGESNKRRTVPGESPPLTYGDAVVDPAALPRVFPLAGDF